MAPAAKQVLPNRQRQSAPRTVVPAIPLPYIQKQKQKEKAQLEARENAAKEEVALQAQVVEPEPSPTPPATEIAPVVDESSDGNTTESVEEAVERAQAEVPAASIVEEEVQEIANEEPEEHEEQVVPEPELSVEEETPDEKHETREPAPSAPSVLSDPPSSASRSTFHMPPAFVPANQNHSSNFTDSVVFPPPNMHFNGNQSMHHAHPSTGSLVFGGYPESNNSSPAPPPSAGNIPPYQYQQPPHLSRHGPQLSNGSHIQHMPNGYGPQAPQGYYSRQDNYMNQGAGDNYARRQMVSFGPPDGYSPSPTPLGFENQRSTYDPSTPHSFQGSQSSIPNEQENSGPAFYSQYPSQHPTAVISNGANGHIEGVHLIQQARPNPRGNSQHLPPTPGSFPVGPPPTDIRDPDTYDGLLYYIQSQFGNDKFADYVLELRYSDDRALPVRIPGHNLLFARSPKLKTLIQNQAQENTGDKSLLIESDDRFLRSEGFWMAVQRLYGLPLLDIGAAISHDLPRNAKAPVAGTSVERFEAALGYAAAGHILEIPPVINRGIEIAGLLVDWDTIEKAIDFATEGGLESQWILEPQPEPAKTRSKYGPHVNFLIYTALTFLIQAFPPNFDLDTSVGEPAYNGRLPQVREDRPLTASRRLTSIKFGDHQNDEPIESQPVNPIHVTLSRILLNLPYHLLKYLLESPQLGNVERWATIPLRQKVMHAVIDEREKRRLRVQHSSYSPERKDHPFNDTVRWQEIVMPPMGPEGIPTLDRNYYGDSAN